MVACWTMVERSCSARGAGCTSARSEFHAMVACWTMGPFGWSLSLRNSPVFHLAGAVNPIGKLINCRELLSKSAHPNGPTGGEYLHCQRCGMHLCQERVLLHCGLLVKNCVVHLWQKQVLLHCALMDNNNMEHILLQDCLLPKRVGWWLCMLLTS